MREWLREQLKRNDSPLWLGLSIVAMIALLLIMSGFNWTLSC